MPSLKPTDDKLRLKFVGRTRGRFEYPGVQVTDDELTWEVMHVPIPWRDYPEIAGMPTVGSHVTWPAYVLGSAWSAFGKGGCDA